MSANIVYMDMPIGIKAFSVQNDDMTFTIVVNKKLGISGDKTEIINEYLCTNNIV